MSESGEFDLQGFLPYLLAQAGDVTSLEFQRYYKARYGMLRTEWRVLFHLGRYGELTAKDICTRAHIHKTKVSRAVAALGKKRFLNREQRANDRRVETLWLTRAGMAAFQDLLAEAQRYDARIMANFTEEEQAILRRCLSKIANP